MFRDACKNSLAAQERLNSGSIVIRELVYWARLLSHVEAINVSKRVLSNVTRLWVLAALGLSLFAPAIASAGSSYSFDFAAANASTYNHETGGGAFNDGGNGSVREELEADDWQCGDIVSFFVRVRNTASPGSPKETIELTLDFAANATGQPGVGYVDVIQTKVNYGVVQNGQGPGGTDAGMRNLSGTSTATLLSEQIVPSGTTPFHGATDIITRVQVTDLDPGETIIVRVDARLGCDPGASPTGNVHASILSANGVAPTASTYSVGNQDVTLKLNGFQFPPSLTLFKSASASSINAGGTVTYFYLVSNNGGQTVNNITVADDQLGTVCNIASLAAGASATCSSATTLQMTTTNIATAVGYAGTNTVISPPSSAVVQVTPALGMFRITKSVSTDGGNTFASSGQANQGATVIYKYVVTNTGTVAINNITITDDKLGFIGTVASLPVGQSVTLTRSTVLNTTSGRVINIATGSGTDANGRPVCANSNPVVVSMCQSADLSIIKTDSADPVTAGATFSYTISVVNGGPTTATNVVVTDPLPSGLTYLGASPPPSSGPNPLVWNLPSLAPSATATFTINVRTDCAGTGLISNTATVSSATPDPVSANNSFTQTTTVNSGSQPTVNCPPDIVINAAPGQCSATGNLGTPTISGSCFASNVSNNAPPVFPLGVTVVTWTVQDLSGNILTCTQRVTVRDNTPPTIVCPPDVTASPDPGSCTSAHVSLGTPTASDNCSGVTVSNNAPAVFPVGTTVVTWTARDAAGNTATCTQQVTVLGSGGGALQIRCPPDVLVTILCAQYCAVGGVFLGCPTVSGGCGNVTICNNAPDIFPLGTTLVTWTVRDAAGNIATCTQRIIVRDLFPPTIICPPDVVCDVDPGSCTSAHVILGTPRVCDNCPGVTVRNNAPAVFPAGVTLVTWTATDAGGNTASCTQRVTIRGSINPLGIICPPDVTVTLGLGQCSLTGCQLGTPTTSGGCGNLTVFNNAPAVFPIGVTVVMWTVRDASGNTATCTQRVTVIGSVTPLTIICPPDIMLNAPSGQCYVTGLQLGTPITSGGCGNLTVSNNAPPNLFPVGTTVVTWTVRDAGGNIAICAQRVIVTEFTPPTIVCPPDITVPADLGQNYASRVNLGMARANDNCPGVTVGNNAPLTFPLGVTIVIWTAMDAAGNSASCPQRVTVVPPVPTTTVTGVKFYDANNNGVQDDGESIIPGWKVKLVGTTLAGRNVSFTAFTSATGVYTFTNIVPGTYTVSEIMPKPTKTATWRANTPISQTIVVSNSVPFEIDFGNIAISTVITNKTKVINTAFWKQSGCRAVLTLDGARFLNTLPPFAAFTPYPNEPASVTPFSETDLIRAGGQMIQYLRGVNATDMRYALAAELLATELSVYYRGTVALARYAPGLDPNAVIMTGGADSLPPTITLQDLLDRAVAAWLLGPGTTAYPANRAEQQAIMGLLNQINSNKAIRVQPTQVLFITPY